MRRPTFRVPKQVRIGADGTGTVTVTAPAGVVWKITRTTVKTSTSVLKPTATIYEGSRADATAFVEDTGKGRGDISDTPHYLNGGESLTCQWTGADVGAIATLTVAGELLQTAV